MLEKLIRWFMVSSADPEKMSLTLKAGIPFAVSALLYFSVTIEAEDLINLTNGAIMIITGAPMIYGAVRKIFLTVKNGGPKPPK